MTSAWDRRIARAGELRKSSAAAAELLDLYARLATLQKSIFEDLTTAPETDPAAVARYFPRLLALVEQCGPPAAAEYARHHLRTESERESMSLAHWNDLSAAYDGGRFLARVLLQPLAEALAARGTVSPSPSSGVCPFCGARPLAAVLRGEGEGARRSLLCSLCATEWEFRRILCPHCAEQHKDKLPVYVAAEFDYIRVEACDTCRTYLKSIDLSRNGLAVPIVDELSSVPLNVWAEVQGYAKLEPNLLGL
jgi:FdhE protein